MPKYRNLVLLTQKYFFARELDKAIDFANRSLQIDSNNSYIYDILAESYMLKGEFESAKRAGVASLKLKDTQDSHYHSYPIPPSPIKQFNREDKSRNIISFSLFGDNPKYCENAIINASLTPDIYPHWSCRFYCDSVVPKDVIRRLRALGAEVIVKASTKDRDDMRLWRFLVMGDSSIDRYLVRDCDAIINTKEAKAVEEWIESDKKFHIMRDFYTHTDLILAGMFGGTAELFPNIKEMIEEFHRVKNPNISHQDQLFLREYIWKSIKGSVMIHDGYFRYDSTQPFPPHPPQPKGHHIGKNEGAVKINVTLKKPTTKKRIRWGLYDKNNTLICRYSADVVDNRWSSSVPIRYLEKIRSSEYFVRSDI